MALQLLTRKECLKTHKYWRIMMKRPVWSALSALQSHESKTTKQHAPEAHRLHHVRLKQTQTAAAAAAAAATAADKDDAKPGQVVASMRNDAWYDDWLHRGHTQPMKSMNQYVYSMWVEVVPTFRIRDEVQFAYSFADHYCKASHYSQVLRYAPRTPYLHGITLPTVFADPCMNSLMQQALFRPTHCPSSAACRSQEAHSGLYFGIVTKSKQMLSKTTNGFANAVRRARPKIGMERFREQWRAYEAHMQVLAQRADSKVAYSRKTPVLGDVSGQRMCFPHGMCRVPDVHDWLLPWLTGSSRHCYYGPWLDRGTQHCQLSSVQGCRTSYDTEAFLRGRTNGVGFLLPLPSDVCLLETFAMRNIEKLSSQFLMQTQYPRMTK